MNEALSREKNKLKEEVNLLQEKIQRLEKSSEHLEMDKFRTENENEMLRKENCDSKRREMLLEEELDGLKMKYSALQSENTDLKLLNSECRVQVKSLKETMDNFDSTLGRLRGKFEDNFEVSLRSMIKQETSLSNIEDKIADFLTMSNRGTECAENLQRLAGNPLEDMTRQMELNSSKIEKLMAENDSLSIVCLTLQNGLQIRISNKICLL
ncbi:PREDICTED: uncharacterized protein LOC108564818 [Nicrophorus vespilloides]|uniref:Uncharacterized protein LOC108564818 n=1 Tax=Nicrophorus vespilloides TaxID=110193 RepID=A0ABM1MY05_NICVS|nr:PREDICTED: uncharacterized protein LOC108564818 [Nicrophorus vespilloides]